MKVITTGGADAEGPRAASFFSKATFTASTAEADCDVNDPDFWKKLLASSKQQGLERPGDADADGAGGGPRAALAKAKGRGLREDLDGYFSDGDGSDAGGPKRRRAGKGDWTQKERQKVLKALKEYGYGRSQEFPALCDITTHSAEDCEGYARAFLKIVGPMEADVWKKIVHFVPEIAAPSPRSQRFAPPPTAAHRRPPPLTSAHRRHPPPAARRSPPAAAFDRDASLREEKFVAGFSGDGKKEAGRRAEILTPAAAARPRAAGPSPTPSLSSLPSPAPSGPSDGSPSPRQHVGWLAAAEKLVRDCRARGEDPASKLPLSFVKKGLPVPGWVLADDRALVLATLKHGIGNHRTMWGDTDCAFPCRPAALSLASSVPRLLRAPFPRPPASPSPPLPLLRPSSLPVAQKSPIPARELGPSPSPLRPLEPEPDSLSTKFFADLAKRAKTLFLGIYNGTIVLKPGRGPPGSGSLARAPPPRPAFFPLRPGQSRAEPSPSPPLLPPRRSTLGSLSPNPKASKKEKKDKDKSKEDRDKKDDKDKGSEAGPSKKRKPPPEAVTVDSDSEEERPTPSKKAKGKEGNGDEGKAKAKDKEKRKEEKDKEKKEKKKTPEKEKKEKEKPKKDWSRRSLLEPRGALRRRPAAQEKKKGTPDKKADKPDKVRPDPPPPPPPPPAPAPRPEPKLGPAPPCPAPPPRFQIPLFLPRPPLLAPHRPTPPLLAPGRRLTPRGAPQQKERPSGASDKPKKPAPPPKKPVRPFHAA
eukprot:tig00020825_g14301.t1